MIFLVHSGYQFFRYGHFATKRVIQHIIYMMRLYERAYFKAIRIKSLD